jgi:hypothetical protein
MSIDFPKEEELVLARWKEIKAFETQVSGRWKIVEPRTERRGEELLTI